MSFEERKTNALKSLVVHKLLALSNSRLTVNLSNETTAVLCKHSGALTKMDNMLTMMMQTW